MLHEISDELAQQGVDYVRVPHGRTQTAAAEAAAIGVPAEDVAKTVVLKTDEGYIRAVVPASERVDVRKIREFAGAGEHVRLATEYELSAAYPTFEVGAVPPFFGPAGDRVIVDRRLAAHDKVVLEPGTHEASVNLDTQDLLRLSRAEVADISTP
jgi:Ala-tRNA(Pro) deacylase